jgi:succinate dehydrogenase / fumarate reductase iron-sulfur subunit
MTSTNLRTFKIYRYNPDVDAKPYMQTIQVQLDGNERMLLDALMKLKAQDPTISFRRSCREGVCGSDAMNINGKNGLACLTNMRTLTGDIVLKPLPGLPVVRDFDCGHDTIFQAIQLHQALFDQQHHAT